MKYLLYLTLLLFALYVLYTVCVLIFHIVISKGLVERAHALEQKGSGFRMLIVGDSTAVGVGATSAQMSIAGLFTKKYPELSIENKGVSGARLADIKAQLQNVDGVYDLILIQGGANDVLSLASMKKVERDAHDVLQLARKHSDKVVMLTAGNIGLAPLIPWPVSLYVSARTRELRTFLLADTTSLSVAYVDLYKERKDDEFSQDPKQFYAADLFHPADMGYALWYSRITETLSAHFPHLVL